MPLSKEIIVSECSTNKDLESLILTESLQSKIVETDNSLEEYPECSTNKDLESLILTESLRSAIVETDNSLEEYPKYSSESDNEIQDDVEKIFRSVSKLSENSHNSTITAGMRISDYSNDCLDMIITEISNDLSLVTKNTSLHHEAKSHKSNCQVANGTKLQIYSVYNDKFEIQSEDCSVATESKLKNHRVSEIDYYTSENEGSISEFKNFTQSQTSSVIYSDKSLIPDEEISEYNESDLFKKLHFFSSKHKLSSIESSIVNKTSFDLDSATISGEHDVENCFCTEASSSGNSVAEILKSEIGHFSTDKISTYPKLDNKKKDKIVPSTDLSISKNSIKSVKHSELYVEQEICNSHLEQNKSTLGNESFDVNNSLKAESSQHYISLADEVEKTDKMYINTVPDARLSTDFKEEFTSSDFETGVNALMQRLQKERNVAKHANKRTLRKRNTPLADFLVNKLQMLQYRNIGPLSEKKLKNSISYLHTTEETALRIDILERLKIHCFLNKIDEDAADAEKNLHNCRKCKSCQNTAAKLDEKLFLQDMLRRVKNKLYSKDLKEYVMLQEVEISS